ncbi:uncharacterized protein LOC128132890 [Lactuca sativa]|uniref:uncharacterized protein LOC128132890 n=1 Tax=Lactuca sativa TaxID=4236 RepID=UPI0022AF419E|nr:uncharacterized protein LOC128132890 [Lactuca sativa]
MSGSGSSTTSGRKSECSMQTEKKNVSKPPVIVKKPKYQWMPKLTSNQSSSSFESVLHDDSKLKGQLRRNVFRSWYVDSGCSRHMTGDISLLSNIRYFNVGYVSFAGGEGGKTTQRGTLTNGVLIFENVNFVECIVIPEEWILVKSKQDGNAYIIEMNSNIPEQVTCLFSKGKNHKKPHLPKQVNSISQLLKLLHVDLFGPVNVLSINRNSYFLVLIDDFSHFTWVFFLSNKVGIADLIKKFILMIENQTNNRVKVLRIDNGTEFTNAVLDHFYTEKGIAEAINIPCYVWNRVLINKAQMKTPYKIFYGISLQSITSVYLFALVPFFTWSPTRNLMPKPMTLEENDTDAKVGPDWLFDYSSLSKSLNVYSDGSSGSSSYSKIVPEDEDEEVVYRPPTVSSSIPTGDSSNPLTCPESHAQHDAPDVDDTPLTPVEREFMSRNASAVTPTFMELLFPEQIADEFVADPSNEVGSSDVEHLANDGVINIHNLPVSLNDISQEIPSQPKNFEMPLNEPSWVDAMHEQLNQFEKLRVWTLVELPKGKKSLETHWVYRNKQDDSGVILRNKERLMVCGFRQIEGLDYTKIYALVARLEAIRIFLAYASYMNFTVYKIDVKTAFLYGNVKEEIYVDQPLGFVNSKFPNHVYKLEKALYELHQAH